MVAELWLRAIYETDILKLLSKPSQFTGEEKDWKAWKFSFMAYVGAVDKTTAPETVVVMKSSVQVNLVDITAEQQQHSANYDVVLVGPVVEEASFVVATDVRGVERLRSDATIRGEGKQDATGAELDGPTAHLGLRVCGCQGKPAGDDGEDRGVRAHG